MQDCGRLCANETVAAVVSASASVTASFVTKDDVMAHLRGSGGRRAGCPKRPVPLGKLHQRADRTSAACSRSMPPVPPRVREETHKPDELTSAAGCSTWSRRVARVPELADLGAHIIGTAPQANGTPFAIIPASISMNRKRGSVTVAAARCWRFRAATSHRPDRCLPVQAP
jgi:hypothetical protein